MELSSYNYGNQTSSTTHLPLRRLRKEVSGYDEHNLNSNGQPQVRQIEQTPMSRGTFAVVTKGIYNPRCQDPRQSSGQPQQQQQRQAERPVCIKAFRYEVKKGEEQNFLELVQVRA